MNEQETWPSAATLKALAREKLLGKYNMTVIASLVYVSVYLLIITLIVPAGAGTPFLYLQLAFIVVSLFMGVFVSGNAYMYLNLIYGHETRLGDLFHGFREQTNKAILLQLVFVLITLACDLPVLLYTLLLGERASNAIIYGLWVVMLLVAYLIRLSLSQSFYLLQDYPERPVRALLSASVRLMHGNRLRLFLLTLTFLPLALLCVITMFVPFLWLRSYYEAAKAAFYQDLMR